MECPLFGERSFEEPMRHPIKTTLAAVLLSSVAIAPLATLTIVSTADAAYAKSEKSGGNGKGGGKGGSSAFKSQKDKQKSKGGSSRGKSGNINLLGKGAKSFAKKGGDAVEGFFQKLTGQDRKPSRTAKSNSKFADSLHPSLLGNMNGALHANENAIAAHIRNGNTNGPVGLMAAYVSGRATTGNALDALGPDAGNYIELNNLLLENGYVDKEGNPDLDAYLVSGDMNTDIDTTLGRTLWSDQQKALSDYGYVDENGTPDLDAYLEDVDGGMLTIAEIETATDTPNNFDEELYASVTDAGDDLTAEDDAAQALIDYWNKQDTAPEGTEAELRALLDTRALELEETSVVMDALPDAQAETAAGCDIEAADCVPEEEVVVVAE